MKFLKYKRARKEVFSRAARAVVCVLMVAVLFQPFFVPNACARCGDRKTSAVICNGCCSMPGCCCIKKNDGPRLPEPLSTARAGSAQVFFNALPAPQLPLLHVLFPGKSGIEVACDDTPHRATAPLAQSCIQLI